MGNTYTTVDNDLIVIKNLRLEENNDKRLIACDIQMPQGKAEQVLWFEMPKNVPVKECLDYNSLAIAGVALGILTGKDIRVEGAVDTFLIDNLLEYIEVWSAWIPEKFSRINIEVQAEVFRIPESDHGAILCFSGGVDSCAALKERLDNNRFSSKTPVRAGLLVQGFDIPLASDSRVKSISKSCKTILNSVGLPLYTVKTNWRDIVPEWRFTHGLALSSCLWLFQGTFASGIIASGDDSYNNLIHGSNPFTDRLISGNAFRVINHGGGQSRINKIAAIAQWPEALACLSVCWADRQGSGNCGKCEKCVRTKLYFYLLGLEPPKSLPTLNLVEEIQALRSFDDLRLKIWKSILQLAIDRGLSESDWVNAVRLKIKDSEHPRSLSVIARKIRNKLVGGK